MVGFHYGSREARQTFIPSCSWRKAGRSLCILSVMAWGSPEEASPQSSNWKSLSRKPYNKTLILASCCSWWKAESVPCIPSGLMEGQKWPSRWWRKLLSDIFCYPKPILVWRASKLVELRQMSDGAIKRVKNLLFLKMKTGLLYGLLKFTLLFFWAFTGCFFPCPWQDLIH